MSGPRFEKRTACSWQRAAALRFHRASRHLASPLCFAVICCKSQGLGGRGAEDRGQGIEVRDRRSEFRIVEGMGHRVKDFEFTPCSMPYAPCTILLTTGFFDCRF